MAADGKTRPDHETDGKGGDEAVSPMTAQNAYQSHETPEAPEEGVLTGARPSRAGRHDPARGARDG